jgi:radical SAM superfamily enzyme YgiQ (UPF0313 family)
MKKRKVMLIWPWKDVKGQALELFPIGLGYLIGNIDRERFDVRILDCVLNDIAPGSVAFAKELKQFNPDIVGISWWSNVTVVVEDTIRVIRQVLPDAILMAGGPHLTGCGDSVVAGRCVDFAFSGEAELGCARLLEAIQDADGFPPAGVLAAIPGLIYRDGDSVRRNATNFVQDLDAVHGIDYESLNLRDYHARGYYYGAKLQKKSELTAPIMTARGCPFHCTFCMAPQIDGRGIRRHSLEQVIGTIKTLYNDFGVRYVAIIDDNFTINKKWAMKVCNAIADLNYPDLAMGTPNGIPLAGMDLELAQAMKRAGWREVMIAPESGSKKTLQAMQKPVNIDAIPDFIRMFHEVGLLVTAFFIIGYPDETLEDIALTRKFIFENDFDFVGISFYQPLPGTDIYNRLVVENIIPKGFIPGHYQEVTFRRPNIDSNVLCGIYNDMWNEYREFKKLPIKNRAVARIRGDMVRSAFAG